MDSDEPTQKPLHIIMKKRKKKKRNEMILPASGT